MDDPPSSQQPALSESYPQQLSYPHGPSSRSTPGQEVLLRPPSPGQRDVKGAQQQGGPQGGGSVAVQVLQVWCGRGTLCLCLEAFCISRAQLLQSHEDHL